VTTVREKRDRYAWGLQISRVWPGQLHLPFDTVLYESAVHRTAISPNTQVRAAEGLITAWILIVMRRSLRAVLSCLPLVASCSCSSTPLYSTCYQPGMDRCNPNTSTSRYETLPCTVRRYHRRRVFFHLILFSLFFNKCTTYCIFPQIRAVLHPCCGVPFLLYTVVKREEGQFILGWYGRKDKDGRDYYYFRSCFWVVPSSIHQSTNRSIDHSIILPYRGK
jgi:hypothetical protein